MVRAKGSQEREWSHSFVRSEGDLCWHSRLGSPRAALSSGLVLDNTVRGVEEKGWKLSRPKFRFSCCPLRTM